MKTTVHFVFLSMFALLISLPSAAQNLKADDVKGLWLSSDGDARIEVYKQGSNYFGKLIWLKEPIDPDTGRPKLDKRNPDPKRHNTPTLGLVIMKDFRFENGEWSNGSIYDPKTGKTYKCIMKMPNRNLLDVRGYVGASWMGLGRTTQWTRIMQ